MPAGRIPENLVYSNVGSFFAKRGYTTVITDYRRANSLADGTGEDAVFPSGGEDVALTLQWLEKHLAEKEIEKRDVFLMGNSAGGLHIATFLYEPRWKEQRLRIVGDGSCMKLRGALLVGIPAHFDQALESRSEVLTTYYGSVENAKKLCPMGLLKSTAEREIPKEAGIPDVLVMTAEYDPYDEIIKPNGDMVELWKKSWGTGLDYQLIKSHNHISTPLGLGTADEEAEKWGYDVEKWMDGKRRSL